MGEEPRIEINGTILSIGQAMALRVAATAYLDEMASNPDALGEDEHGRRMTGLYADRLNEVVRIMIGANG
ncbi:hypothetical protein EN866_32830 [Mesorhizobium sp. M2D.F.Ca.ET.223.01.1.1]|uniref:hypothetical protein n=1 Tax=Mesorhizobium sp. M2D.F.Ca.ET.223.01.1.1 TaxID=2563940 RepID=UPI001092C830|nr:hypothetical protein [Mesorhizobium sp. M2D.F.Ca.ET.223.01.1.1]TGR84593.1 hypothetical protein EN866_32830 [Mesorhizobium sp. M2D.F.Ca.ET.223.01.1.1]TGT70704.1 hypothetical protein EN802_20465 [bacterium M00.F.Ca.ET.159.01.1.1]TGT82347.1 hypothetical protein EN800_18625 [bacterium M00.F.Ca.ET.157.01.1.1]